MKYETENITQRAMESALWDDLSKQNSEVLPFLLERYLLLENWNKNNGLPIENIDDEIKFLHLLVAELTTVVLNQEERIRKLEENTQNRNIFDVFKPNKTYS